MLFVWREAWTGLRRNITMSIAMVLTTAISLGALGAGLLIVRTIDRTEDLYYSQLAVQVALDALPTLDGDVLVTYGDVPMLTADTLVALVADHRGARTSVSVLTARVTDPTGYGRIVRGTGDDVLAIVEEREATTIVPPGDAVQVDDTLNLRIAIAAPAMAGELVTAEMPLAEAMARIEADPMNPRFVLTVRGAGYKMRDAP